ncbi:MAG: alkane 1-monooxygenase [Pseudomonadales bacterium]|nr:alkane 1-monooxygenase [Pseudomonadales bacterium]
MTAVTVAPWHDSKRLAWLLAILPMILPLLAIGLGETYLNPVVWYLGPVVVFVVIPLLDYFLGEDTNNPPESVVAGLEKIKYYRYAVYAAVIMEWIGVMASAWVIAHEHLGWVAYLGLSLTVGFATGISINTAHELGHKNNNVERWLARLALAPTFYGHFVVEHNYGHHLRVATPEDPATSRFGETFYRFLPRSVVGGIKSAWDIEAQRLHRRGYGVWTWRNEHLQSWAISVVLWGGLLAAWGWVVLPFLLIQGFYGFSLLEVVNYLEHYGLLRQKRPDGRYERCSPEHSWNSNHIVTNVFLYQLQRHSDHHANPTRCYQALRHFETSPQLPAGYATMIMAAYVPPLWFAIMNPRVAHHYAGRVERVNVQPGKEVYARQIVGSLHG